MNDAERIKALEAENAELKGKLAIADERLASTAAVVGLLLDKSRACWVSEMHAPNSGSNTAGVKGA